MQKKIIALAIAAAMAAPVAALAEVTVYGIADMSVDMTNDGGDQASTMGTADNKRTQIASNQSRLGLKGSDDLGNGMKALWQMEAGVAMDTGDTTITNGRAQTFNRNTFVGLGGGFGTVILGNHDTMYKMATRKLDVFADSIADNRGSMGGGVLDARATDVLAYVSPEFSGVTVAAAMVGETDNSLDTLKTVNGAIFTTGNLIGATTLFVNYAREGITASVSTIGLTEKTAGAASTKVMDVSGTKLAGGYSTDMFSVGLIYEMISLKPGVGDKTDSSNIYIGGTYNLSEAGSVKLAYTMIGDSKTGSITGKDGGSQLSLGYDHEMTKSTTLYALYTGVSNHEAGNNGLFGLDAGGTVSATTAAGNPSALSFGMRHSF